MDKDEKTSELLKYHTLLQATLDYYIDNHLMQVKTADFDSSEHFKSLKLQTDENYKKGRLTMLKNWFRDMTEMPLETGDLKFNQYLRDKTGYNIDIFKSYFQRIDKIITKGKITTDRQFYDINEMVGQLCQVQPVDTKKIDALNKLLADYESRKTRK
ncbi:MAG: hypothetical protein V4506_05295 [Bacteroidota bacterium]